MAASIGRRLLFEMTNKHNFHKHLVYRTLLSDSDLKLEGYLRQRIFLTDQLGPAKKGLMMCKMKEITTSEDAKNSAFVIADFVHFAETEEELSELERLFKLLGSHSNINLQAFNFGASLLRLYHHLGLSDRAYELYKDPTCRVLLHGHTCHKILMDLLYKQGQYELVLDAYLDLPTFNNDCVTLALGAYYHINTHESCEAAKILIQDLMKSFSLSRRALLFAAMLCLNHNQPAAALEILRKCKENILVFNVTMMCKARLGHYQDVLQGLEDAIRRSNNITLPLNTRLYSDVMIVVRQAMVSCDNQNIVHKFKILEEELSSMGVFSQQRVAVLLDKTIFGEHSNTKQSGKKKVVL